MSIEIHRSSDRGATKLGWLNSRHSFSFGGYHEPSRMGFGALRVLNDDIVAPGAGFGAHPHQNMEIVTIVLEGALEHQDSLGTRGVVHKGEIQRMTAGSGIVHSEINHSVDETVRFLQIWIIPNEAGLPPQYEQMSFAESLCDNTLVPIVKNSVDENTLFIHQDAAFYLSRLDKGASISHEIADATNGAYVYLISGTARLNGHELFEGDGAAMRDIGELTISADEKSDILLIEAPLVE